VAILSSLAMVIGQVGTRPGCLIQPPCTRLISSVIQRSLRMVLPFLEDGLC
jgi:hypothetical protein